MQNTIDLIAFASLMLLESNLEVETNMRVFGS